MERETAARVRLGKPELNANAIADVEAGVPQPRYPPTRQTTEHRNRDEVLHGPGLRPAGVVSLLGVGPGHPGQLLGDRRGRGDVSQWLPWPMDGKDQSRVRVCRRLRADSQRQAEEWMSEHIVDKPAYYVYRKEGFVAKLTY